MAAVIKLQTPKLDGAIAILKNGAPSAMAFIAEAWGEDALKKVPVHTGFLRDSIVADSTPFTASILSDVRYAKWVQIEQPFFPTVRRARVFARDVLRDAIKEGKP